jgi:hypothetical protein
MDAYLTIICRVCKKELLTLTDPKQIKFHESDVAPHAPKGIRVADIYMCRECSDAIINKKEEKNDARTTKRKRTGTKLAD